MNTQIVYVIVSDENDSLLEQTLTSVCSLRMHTPDAKVFLITDRSTDNTLAGERAKILNYITEKKVIDIPDGYTKVQRSRYLKTSLRQYIQGDFLYVDSDTIIIRDLADADALKMEMGAVLDGHLMYSKHPAYDKRSIKKRLLKINMNLSGINDRYFNGGVQFVRDTPRTRLLYKEWHKAWQESISLGVNRDQPALAKANYLCGNIIEELPNLWNFQTHSYSMTYYQDNAYILHYFASNYGVPTYVKKLSRLSVPELNKLITVARRTSFPMFSLPITEREIELLHSEISFVFHYSKKMYGILKWLTHLYLSIKGRM